MQGTVFAVNDEPYCLWEHDVREETKRFLRGLDPDFFSYLLDSYGGTEDETKASVAVRLSLHHAVETVYSLLCAFVQAPHCPYAWISQCQTKDLRQVVERIGKGDPKLLIPWERRIAEWKDVAAMVLRTFEPGSDKQTNAIDGFGYVWSALSQHLLDRVTSDEYNALKHGFRTQAGGIHLQIGRQPAPGIPAPESAMQSLGGSKFGASFREIRRHKVRGGQHLTSTQHSVNWSLERDILLLQLCQLSIANAISALKVENGFPPSSCAFNYLPDPEDYRRPWTHSPGLLNFSLGDSVDPKSFPELTKQQLLAKLRMNGS